MPGRVKYVGEDADWLNYEDDSGHKLRVPKAVVNGPTLGQLSRGEVRGISRDGIEDRRGENAPPQVDRSGTLLEGLPATPHEAVMYQRRLVDNDNYLRRTAGLPERPMPANIAPAAVQHARNPQFEVEIGEPVVGPQYDVEIGEARVTPIAPIEREAPHSPENLEYRQYQDEQAQRQHYRVASAMARRNERVQGPDKRGEVPLISNEVMQDAIRADSKRRAIAELRKRLGLDAESF